MARRCPVVNPTVILPNSRSVWFAALLFLVAYVNGLNAETLKISCEDNRADPPVTMTVVYEGDSSGMLRIAAPFGEANLPATREERHNRDGDKVLGIRAFGPAEMLMPEKENVEACIAEGKDSYARLGASDLGVMNCVERAVLSDVPVPVRISATIAIIDPPDAEVQIQRTHLEESDPDLRIEVDTFPPPCTIENDDFQW